MLRAVPRRHSLWLCLYLYVAFRVFAGERHPTCKFSGSVSAARPPPSPGSSTGGSPAPRQTLSPQQRRGSLSGASGGARQPSPDRHVAHPVGGLGPVNPSALTAQMLAAAPAFWRRVRPTTDSSAALRIPQPASRGSPASAYHGPATASLRHASSTQQGPGYPPLGPPPPGPSTVVFSIDSILGRRSPTVVGTPALLAHLAPSTDQAHGVGSGETSSTTASLREGDQIVPQLDPTPMPVLQVSPERGQEDRGTAVSATLLAGGPQLTSVFVSPSRGPFSAVGGFPRGHGPGPEPPSIPEGGSTGASLTGLMLSGSGNGGFWYAPAFTPQEQRAAPALPDPQRSWRDLPAASPQPGPSTEGAWYAHMHLPQGQRLEPVPPAAYQNLRELPGASPQPGPSSQGFSSASAPLPQGPGTSSAHPELLQSSGELVFGQPQPGPSREGFWPVLMPLPPGQSPAPGFLVHPLSWIGLRPGWPHPEPSSLGLSFASMPLLRGQSTGPAQPDSQPSSSELLARSPQPGPSTPSPWQSMSQRQYPAPGPVASPQSMKEWLGGPGQLHFSEGRGRAARRGRARRTPVASARATRARRRKEAPSSTGDPPTQRVSVMRTAGPSAASPGSVSASQAPASTATHPADRKGGGRDPSSRDSVAQPVPQSSAGHLSVEGGASPSRRLRPSSPGNSGVARRYPILLSLLLEPDGTAAAMQAAATTAPHAAAGTQEGAGQAGSPSESPGPSGTPPS